MSKTVIMRAVAAAAVVAALSIAVPIRSADTSMNAEIDFLLRKVAESNCLFVRNGHEHDGAAARKHLQMKRLRGRKYYHSTEEFIERIASRSSWTGKPYLIRCAGGPGSTAQAWFTALLKEYRATGT